MPAMGGVSVIIVFALMTYCKNSDRIGSIDLEQGDIARTTERNHQLTQVR